MAGTPGVILDTINFYDREVPDTIPWGGKQQLAIHKNIGGTRIIDAMGPDPHTITWSGAFYSFGNSSGSNLANTSAAVRARAVDTLRKSGKTVWLYWGTFAYQVIVSDFVASYKHEWVIHYRVSCEVVQDGPTQQHPQTLDQAVGADMTTITSLYTSSPTSSPSALPASPTSSTVTPAMVSALNSAAQALGVTQFGTPLQNMSLAQIQPVIAAIESAYATMQSLAVSPAGIDLDAQSGPSILDGINNFMAEANNIASESDGQTIIAYLGRIVGNLTTATG